MEPLTVSVLISTLCSGDLTFFPEAFERASRDSAEELKDTLEKLKQQ